MTTANSIAALAGGGIDLPPWRHTALRLVDAGWLRTELPNAANDMQNTFRIDFGMPRPCFLLRLEEHRPHRTRRAVAGAGQLCMLGQRKLHRRILDKVIAPGEYMTNSHLRLLFVYE
jgi:hypothetical protein